MGYPWFRRACIVLAGQLWLPARRHDRARDMAGAWRSGLRADPGLADSVGLYRFWVSGRVKSIPCRSIACMNSAVDSCAGCDRPRAASAPMRTPLIMSKIEVRRKDGRAATFGLDLVRLDTDHWKSWVHERLRWPTDQIGGWHLFRGVDDDYCHQIVSEARLKQPTGKVEWVQRSRANHFFDCEAMLAACGYLLNVQRIPLPNVSNRPKGGGGRQPETQPEVIARLNAPPVQPPVNAQGRRVRRIVRSSYLGG